MTHIRRTASQEVLHKLVTGGALILAAQSPYFWIHFYKNFFKGTPLRNDQVRDAFRYLRRKHYIILEKRNKQMYIRLTPEGEKHAGKYQINNLNISIPKKWDGKWRLIIFDIPEKLRMRREAFRGKLKELGFFPLQKSIWAYPYPCENEMKLLRGFFNLNAKHIRFFEVEKMEEDAFLKRIFNVGI